MIYTHLKKIYCHFTAQFMLRILDVLGIFQYAVTLEWLSPEITLHIDTYNQKEYYNRMYRSSEARIIIFFILSTLTWFSPKLLILFTVISDWTFHNWKLSVVDLILFKFIRILHNFSPTKTSYAMVKHSY